MIYKVKENLEFQGKIFRPGSLIKLSKKEYKEFSDRVEIAQKFTKVVTNRRVK